MQSFLIFSTGILAFVSLAPLLPINHWFIRVWEFPRVQICFLLLLNIAVTLIFLEDVLLLTLVLVNSVCLLYQLFWVLPYTSLAPKQVLDGQFRDTRDSTKNTTISIITSNVLMTNKSADKLIEMVRAHKPDILVTLESNQWWQDALSPLHSIYPHRVARPLENLYGMHVYSKHELLNVELVDLIEKDVPSVHCQVQLAEDVLVNCHFVHPAPPSPTENETATPRDKELLLVADYVDERNRPTIVTGDLNDVAWSPTTRAFRKKSGLLDPRLGRGFFNTFHAKYAFARWPLDHIFHSHHFRLSRLLRLPSIDSDHFPLLSELVLVEPDKAEEKGRSLLSKKQVSNTST